MVSRHPIEVGLLTPHNAMDLGSFSGTTYQAANSLRRHESVSLHLLGPHHRRSSFLERLTRRTPPKPDFDKNDIEGLDVVIGLVASKFLDKLHQLSDIPYLHVSDATPQFLREFYGYDVPAEADRVEQRVTSHAQMNVYSSEFMAARAAREFNVPKDRLCSVPFGVNLDNLPEHKTEKPPLSTLNLLFVGLDWKRKGGDIAISAMDHLREMGREAHLTIVGAKPEGLGNRPDVSLAGYLDKNKPRDRQRIDEIYQQTHLLILPTRGDCTPMVIGEAMQFSTPVLATDTGGVADMIGTDGAGATLSLSAEPEAWAIAINDFTNDPTPYQEASVTAFTRSQKYFSWDSWAKSIVQIAESIVR